MKDLKRYYILNAPPEEVYAALTNATTIKLWSGEDAVMSDEPDSEFSMFDGSIVGKNLSFEKNFSIVQQWYFEGQEENSVVTFKLHPHKSGTSVEVRHVNIPDDAFDDISEGWDEIYFANLSEFYED